MRLGIAAVAIVVSLALLYASQPVGASESDTAFFIGEWERGFKDDGASYTETLVFDADGTGTFDTDMDGTEPESFEWEIVGERLLVTQNGDDIYLDYDFSTTYSELTLSNETMDFSNTYNKTLEICGSACCCMGWTGLVLPLGGVVAVYNLGRRRRR